MRDNLSAHLSSRGAVEPFHAMDVLARANGMAAQGEDVAMLCVGQPAAPAPRAARQAAAQAIETGSIGYTDALGRADLRQAIATHYGATYGVDVPAARVAVTTGSSAGFTLAFLACLNPGDRVVLAAPGYPAYRNILKALSLEAVEIETGPETRFNVMPEHLEAAGPLHAVLLASPANPTGSMMTPEELAAITGWCDENEVLFVSDEIYHGLVYDGAPRQATALETSGQAIIVNSFSKYFCMTGWRIGWLVLPDYLVAPIEKLAQSLYISAPEVSQIAALHALGAVDELEAVKAGYAANRRLMLERLPSLGFTDIAPMDGAFYAYADAGRLTNDTMDFAYKLLQKAKVAITPGLDFDRMRGSRTVRLSFAGAQSEIKTALDRMERWLR